MARPNISLAVHRCIEETDQQRAVIEAVTSTGGPGIVYVGTRKAAEHYADELLERGLSRRRTTPDCGCRYASRCRTTSWPDGSR